MRWAAPVLCSLGALYAVDLSAQEALRPFAPPQNDYVLACAGCHGLDGASHSKVVPRLKGRAGYYLADPEGRAYLSRLPNVAQTASDGSHLESVPTTGGGNFDRRVSRAGGATHLRRRAVRQ